MEMLATQATVLHWLSKDVDYCGSKQDFQSVMEGRIVWRSLMSEVWNVQMYNEQCNLYEVTVDGNMQFADV